MWFQSRLFSLTEAEAAAECLIDDLLLIKIWKGNERHGDEF